MNVFRKFLALLVAGVMVLSLGVMAYAAGTTYTITINQTQKDHTYAAYQIFAGDLSDGVLSNIKWGSGVNETGRQAMHSAADKAKTINNSEAAATFASDLVDNNYLGSPAGTATYSAGTGYKIGNLDPGYYLVMDTNSNLADGEAMTKYILKVVEDVSADPKNAGVPTVEKKITGENNDKVSEASIGDTVSFETTATIPADAAKYNRYYFVINDTMTKGLEFKADTVEVKINGSDASAGTDYTLYTGAQAENNTFQIALKNAKAHAGQTVVVTYSAVLTKDAEVAGDGNVNTANVKYSNNPNYNYGDKDRPGGGDPAGETPDSKTTTYTTGLTIHKIDENNQALKGASFKISGNGVNIVLVSSEVFEADNSGAYWKLNNGTYTTVDPSTLSQEAQGKYESTSAKYKKTVTFTPKNHDTATGVTAAVGDDGVLTFNGLGAGTYTISETVTPAGFNTIEDFQVVISFNAGSKTFTAQGPEGQLDASGNVISMNVVNNSGTTLPSTGGMGTTVLYVLGGLLLCGAALLLFMRRKMNSN